MIEIQEYLDAGFTEAQAALLVRRDRRVDLLEDSINRGFADVLTTLQVMQNAMQDGFRSLDQRLARVEEHLARPGRN